MIAMGKTLFDKIWDAHTVSDIAGGPTQLYIDRHYCHEVTSPQAFDGSGTEVWVFSDRSEQYVRRIIISLLPVRTSL